MEIALECKTRPEGSKPRAMRREGLLPATLYGHKGAESTALMLETKKALALLRKASVNNTLVNLSVPELDWNGKTLIREVQAHPWKRTLYHLSFFAVGAQGSVEVVVPLNLVGESAGVKKGGIIEQSTTEVKIQCPPESIPETLDVDMNPLDIGVILTVGDLALPEGIRVIDEPEKTILTIIAPAKMAGEDEA